MRDGNLVLESFRIGKLVGVYKEEDKLDKEEDKLEKSVQECPFVIYRKIQEFSIQDSLQREDMPRTNLGQLLKDAQAYPVVAAFDGGESFYADMSFYTLAQKIDDSQKISSTHKKTLSQEDAKKCWELLMKQAEVVHLFNGKNDGLESKFALGRGIGIALELEPESSEKYWKLKQKLHFT